MATLDRSNFIIAADVQTGRQTVQAGARPRTQHKHTKERDRKYINRTAHNINIRQSEIVWRDGELWTCMVVYTKTMNFTMNYVNSERNRCQVRIQISKTEQQVQHATHTTENSVTEIIKSMWPSIQHPAGALCMHQYRTTKADPTPHQHIPT
jgi:hypothetical protein